MRRNIQPRLITASDIVPVPYTFKTEIHLRENQLIRKNKTIITDPSYFLSMRNPSPGVQPENFLPTPFSLLDDDFKGLDGVGVDFLNSSPRLEDYNSESYLVDDKFVEKKMYFKLKEDKDEMFRLSKQFDPEKESLILLRLSLFL